VTLKPVDGTAVILHLIEAARAWARWGTADGPDPESSNPVQNLADWVNLLEERLAAEIPDEQEAGWEARTWGELLPGDRVSLQGVEALVKQVALLPWHVEPDPEKGVRQVWHPGYNAVDEGSGAPEHCRACRGRCQRGRGFQMFPLEHSQVRITLEFGGQVNSYQMAPGGEIEVLRGPAGIEIDRAAGRGAGQVRADREMVLESWAAEAFQTLAAAGLSPEPQIMTMESEA
jgi:hypothetical protein